jgi:hypothetical protein
LLGRRTVGCGDGARPAYAADRAERIIHST